MKKPWKSKTKIANLLVCLSGFWPPAGNFISENPEIFAMGIGLLNMGLRSVSGEKITWKIFSKEL